MVLIILIGFRKGTYFWGAPVGWLGKGKRNNLKGFHDFSMVLNGFDTVWI